MRPKEHSELEMLLTHHEPQITSVGLQDGDVEIGILQAQCYHPVSRVEGRQDLS